jgi:hypothetical protein
MATTVWTPRRKHSSDLTLLTSGDELAGATAQSDTQANPTASAPVAASAGAPDSDGDGVPDSVDNALIIPNPNQRDTNGDGFANICDPDLNNDGVVSTADYLILRGRLGTGDPGADLNGDGRVSAADYLILRGFLTKPPGPNFNSPHVIWRDGAAGVTLGTEAAPTTFSVGTNAGALTTSDIWTGAIPSGNDNWSILDNWADTSVPTAADVVMFDAVDSGGLSRVDAAFEGTIAGYADTGQGVHTLQLDRTLQVNGPVSIHTANAYDLGLLNVFNTNLTLHLTEWNVGVNAAGSGTAVGWLTIDGGTVVDATDVAGVNVGLSVGGSATGTLNLAAGTALTMGSAALSVGAASGGSAKGTLNLASGAAEGTLKLASNSTLNADLLTCANFRCKSPAPRRPGAEACRGSGDPRG